MDERFKQTLKEIVDKLNGSGLGWFLIGGTSQIIQGLNRNFNDIDIGVKYEDYFTVKELFKDNEIKESDTFDKKGKRFTFESGGIEVDILGLTEDSAHLSMLGNYKIKKINFEGIEVNCYPVEIEANIYEKYGKPERAEQLRRLI